MSLSTDRFIQSSPSQEPRHATRAVHGGAPRRAHGTPLVAPIAQGATFAQSEPGAASEHTYSRASNPTVSELEDRLGAFEGVARLMLAAVESVRFTVVLVAAFAMSSPS